MLIQNNIFKFANKPQASILQLTSYPMFKGNEVSSIDRLELGNVSTLESGLAKLDKITKEEYDTLTEQEKVALRSYSVNRTDARNSLEEDVKSHYYIANVIKTMMDKQFGEGNYVIIPVGRSLSSVGKLLELQIGKDNVKNIPLSTIQRYYKSAEDGFEENISTINNFLSKDKFKDFKEYLSSIGLDKETVESSGKNYVIMDYAYTGESIRAARDILTCDELMGNSKQNVHAVSINQIFDLVKANDMHEYEINRSRISQINDDLAASRYKSYSFVGQLFGQLAELDSAVDYKIYAKNFNPEYYDHIVKTHKIFGFNLLDTEFSGKKKPCQKEVSFINDKKSYSDQKRYLWYDSRSAQLFDETRLDAKEIYKVMGKLKEPVGMLRYYTKKLREMAPEKEALLQEEFKEVNESFNELKELANKTLKEYGRYNRKDEEGDYYYSTFRPMLLDKIQVLSKKFCGENKEKLLATMEKRFNQMIRGKL